MIGRLDETFRRGHRLVTRAKVAEIKGKGGDPVRRDDCGGRAWELYRVSGQDEQLAELKRIRDYGGAPLPVEADARRLALEDRVRRMTAWLWILAEEMERRVESL